MSKLERLQGVKNAYRKGIITYGEYLGVCAEVIQLYEAEQPLDSNWHDKPDYKALMECITTDEFVC